MRLDKFLALLGLGSRSEVRALLRAGRVLADGKVVRDHALIIDEKMARIDVDGRRLIYQPTLHLMMNKPAGVLTAAEDSRRLTVMELLPPHARSLSCMPVGRLDLDTEGLLIFTTDGQLAHRLLSPKKQVEKLYFARLDSPLCEADVAAFAGGLTLSDFVALPARLSILEDPLTAHVTVCEGKFHQVKRMFAACGKQVVGLKRLMLGGVWLDDALAPGAWRALAAQEIDLLYRVSGSQSEGL